jgi:hypothetical protein
LATSFATASRNLALHAQSRSNRIPVLEELCHRNELHPHLKEEQRGKACRREPEFHIPNMRDLTSVFSDLHQQTR